MSDIPNLVFDLPKGEAKPEDAKAALLAIRHVLNEERALTKIQRVYLRQALNLWASGMTLEQSFGFKRHTRGRTSIPEQRQIAIAVAVLWHYLQGRGNLEMAAELAGAKLGIAGTQARMYFERHKLAALEAIRRERPVSSNPWSAREKNRLRAIGF